MALSGPQFDFFESRLDEFQGRLLSIETDIAALEVLITSTNTKLDTLVTALTSVDTGIGTLVTAFGSVDTNVAATVSTIGATNTVLDRIRQKLVGVRSG